MSTIVVSHAFGASDDSVWFPYLKATLEDRGHRVVIPRLPDSAAPRLESWRDALAEHVDTIIAQDTVLVGHSLGAVNVLRLLEKHDVGRKGAFAGVVLVAAPAWVPPGYDSVAEFFIEPFDWALLQRAARRYRLLTSLDDPVLVPQPMDHVKHLVARLGATALLTATGAHFGGAPDDHIDLPEAVQLVLECLADS